MLVAISQLKKRNIPYLYTLAGQGDVAKEIASSKYDRIKDLNKLDDLYDYELELSELMQEMSLAVLEKNLGELLSNPKKKSNCTQPKIFMQ